MSECILPVYFDGVNSLLTQQGKVWSSRQCSVPRNAAQCNGVSPWASPANTSAWAKLKPDTCDAAIRSQHRFVSETWEVWISGVLNTCPDGPRWGTVQLNTWPSWVPQEHSLPSKSHHHDLNLWNLSWTSTDRYILHDWGTKGTWQDSKETIIKSQLTSQLSTFS